MATYCRAECIYPINASPDPDGSKVGRLGDSEALSNFRFPIV